MHNILQDVNNHPIKKAFSLLIGCNNQKKKQKKCYYRFIDTIRMILNIFSFFFQ